MPLIKLNSKVNSFLRDSKNWRYSNGDPMTINKEWPCKHIKKLNDKWHYIFTDELHYDSHKLVPIIVPDGSNICPIINCKAKRPEEPKSLWEIYRDAELTIGCCREVTMIALKWFEDNLPKGDIFRSEIKELLDKERDKCR